jgi:gas vesicle protein
MQDSSLSSFRAGVAIGGLTGAALGLLLAPESGEEMRGHVSELIEETRVAFDEAVNEGRAAAEQVRAEIEAAGGQPEAATT